MSWQFQADSSCGRARARGIAGVLAAGVLLLSGCATPAASADETLRVVASTPIIADFVRQVAPEAEVSTLVPLGADPHTYEPSMAALRDIAHADIAFSNQLLLEEQSLLSTIDANLPEGARHVGLGPEAVRFGGYHIPLVENAALSTVWLGLRVEGAAARMCAVDSKGPGDISAFTTGTFGQPSAWMASSDGFDDDDCVSLPSAAHTHMSWGFSRPGWYELQIEASSQEDAGAADAGAAGGSGAGAYDDSTAQPQGDQPTRATVTFAVGVDPYEAGKQVIDAGHVDISTTREGGLAFTGESGTGEKLRVAPSDAVIAVPNTTETTVPGPDWAFLGDPGAPVWILAQAVIGRHVHGEVDPHMWHDVSNAIAYVDVIADELSRIDPAGSYREHAAKYVEKLRALDNWTRQVMGSIPRAKRTLVTAHDSFGYFARAYDLDISGFVAPNPSIEPSVQQLSILTQTLVSTPAAGVFVEPTSDAHANQLAAVAQATGKQVCELYSDTLTAEVPTYAAMVERNVRSLKSCLDPAALPAWPLEGMNDEN